MLENGTGRISNGMWSLTSSPVVEHALVDAEKVLGLGGMADDPLGKTDAAALILPNSQPKMALTSGCSRLPSSRAFKPLETI